MLPTSLLLAEVQEGGHLFQKHTYHSPTWCDSCKELLWGIANQGFKCRTCGFNAHDKCRKQTSLDCGMHRKLGKDEVFRVNGHDFATCTYHSPTWCNNCNNFIWGFQNQGWKCGKCGVNAHGRCVVDYGIPCFISHPAGVGVLEREQNSAELRSNRLVLPADGFNIEDGQFGGTSHSFFVPIDSDRLSVETASTQSLENEDYRFQLFQNSEHDDWFASTFKGKEYDMYIAKTAEPFFITTMNSTNETNDPVVHAILWLPTGKEQLIIPVLDKEPPSIYDIVARAHYLPASRKVPILKAHRKTELYRRAEKLLLQAESAQQCDEITVAVVCQLANQRDGESILDNNDIPEPLKAFLDVVASRVDLRGYEDFAGGLDTSEQTLSGRYSYAAQFSGNKIMFHIAPFLPKEQERTSSLALRTAFDRTQMIKNNVVCVVIMDENCSRFDPAYIPSKTIHTFACVKTETTSEGAPQYRLNFSSNTNMPQFGPRLPNPPVFSDPEKLKNFFLAKLINATKASFTAPTFQARRNQAVASILNDLEDSLSVLTYEVPSKKKFGR